MNELTLRILERVHGHLGWLSVASLIHPAIVLRNPKRRARLAATLSTGLVTSGALLGAWIYPRYRLMLKQAIFRTAPSVGWMFERKEHLAVGVVIFAWTGLVAHLASLSTVDEALRTRLARIAHRSYALASIFGIVVGVIGIAVASTRTF